MAISYKQLLKTLLFLATFSVVSVVFSPKTEAAYQHGRLIDDSVFLDARSMSISDIQGFLVSKNAGLRNMQFTLSCYGAGSTERQLYTSAGARCDTPVPASEVIYYAAQIYGVSPKVILATMQKEQSLTTAPNPTSWQLSQAMGYACPTSGSCSDSSTFSYQIDSGTWALRYHYERAKGNMNWWHQSTSWTCGTAKPSYYVPNLYPRQNVNFVDPYSGVQYATVYIENAATSAFYCYTPHVFNNHNNSPHPNEPKGSSRCYSSHPVSGDRGRCYTGSYNFVYYYELWFGSTSGRYFSGQLRAQSPNPYVFTGESTTVYMQFTNTGTTFWKDDTNAFSGYPPIHLATSNPLNRFSDFRANSWVWGNRPNAVFTKVLEADGVTLASDQHTVFPGQVAEFQFKITVPFDYAGGVYREYFQPIAENSADFSLGTWTSIDIYVVKSSHKAAYAHQSPHPTIVAGDAKISSAQIKNVGNTVWYDDASVPAGKYPVHLAATGPINRLSIFNNAWPGPNRSNLRFSKVFEADGVTLTSNQHLVHPGQVAQFDIPLVAPYGKSSGVYREYFQPVLEGAPGYTWDMGMATYFDIKLEDRTFKASSLLQSPAQVIARGQTKTVFFDYKNTGNAFWKDASAAIPGYPIVRIATTSPINRGSTFGTVQWPVISRPSDRFQVVLESDGVTFAQDQKTVLPGQIVRYAFDIYAPSTLSPGVYKEHFQPVVEPSPAWNLGPISTLDITVQ